MTWRNPLSNKRFISKGRDYHLSISLRQTTSWKAQLPTFEKLMAHFNLKENMGSEWIFSLKSKEVQLCHPTTLDL
jgi:hypothetical protein